MNDTDTTAPNPTDDEIVNNTATKQLAAIKEQLRQRDMHRRSQEQVQAALKAEGIDLDAINVEEQARQLLTEMQARDQRLAAQDLAKAMYFETTGKEFSE